MLIVGLTGNIASGKSTVARLFSARGAAVVDADELSREVVRPGTAAFDAIVARWGRGVVAADGSLDRAALRRVVFADARERAALDGMVHPAVGARLAEERALARARGERVFVCDVPLLFEANLSADVDLVVLVDAPEAVRLERLVRDRGLDAAEAAAMMAAQMPAARKRLEADFVIDNAGTRDALERRVDEVWRSLLNDPRAAPPVA